MENGKVKSREELVALINEQLFVECKKSDIAFICMIDDKDNDKVDTIAFTSHEFVFHAIDALSLHLAKTTSVNTALDALKAVMVNVIKQGGKANEDQGTKEVRG